MSRKTPKTGLAQRMRSVMKARHSVPDRFTSTDLYHALKIPPGPQRVALCSALRDFVRRGEVLPASAGPSRKKRFIYNLRWRRRDRGEIKARILKAMYVSVIFTTSEIQRFSKANEASFVKKLTKRLLDQGWIRVVGRRRTATGGWERVYHILDRDRFRLELMP